MRGWTGGTHPHFPPPFPPFPSPSPPLPSPPTPLPSPFHIFPSPWSNCVLIHKLKRSHEPKLILKIAYQRFICIFRVQRVKTYSSLFVLMLNLPDTPSWNSGREKSCRRNYFKIKFSLKYGTRPRSNSQPLHLQSDMHLRRLRCAAP